MKRLGEKIILQEAQKNNLYLDKGTAKKTSLAIIQPRQPRQLCIAY